MFPVFTETVHCWPITYNLWLKNLFSKLVSGGMFFFYFLLCLFFAWCFLFFPFQWNWMMSHFFTVSDCWYSTYQHLCFRFLLWFVFVLCSKLFKIELSLSFCFVFTGIRGGRYRKNIISHIFFYTSRFLILSQFFVMLVFLFWKLFEQYSQTNFPIIKTKPFKVKKYKKEWWIFRPKWAKIKIFVIIYLSLKMRRKMHNTNTHTIQIKHSVLFSGTIGVFSRSIQEID